ncbi:TIGR02270 family protein [Gemmatimonadota bacterium]
MIPVVLSQHAEEAAFQWLLRDLAVHEPHYDLKDLAKLDDRVEAHLDGLRIAGDPGWEICKEELAWEEAGEVFAAASLAFGSDKPELISEVLEAVGQSTDLARGAISALGWMPYDRARSQLENLLKAEDPIRQRIAIGASAVHREDPGLALTSAVATDDSIVRSRALKAAGELGRTDLLGSCPANFEAEDEPSRIWAAWSAALLGHHPSAYRLAEIAVEGGTRAEMVCDLATRRMTPAEALGWHGQLVSEGSHLRLAATAARALGDSTLVPWLFEIMESDELARPAGEAFSIITGLDLAYEDLEGEWPEGFEAGPTEAPEDEDVAMDPDEDLPWPDLELVRGWWAENGGRFSAGTRYLRGEPISEASLMDVLKFGKQRERAAAALELALLGPDQPLFEVRARGDVQRRLLGG